ncbi:hypothetical protein NL676_011364 [Syzygium grande]|nr:hypothetical protein NL676_011364 [Syzygium grande]
MAHGGLGWVQGKDSHGVDFLGSRYGQTVVVDSRCGQESFRQPAKRKDQRVTVIITRRSPTYRNPRTLHPARWNQVMTGVAKGSTWCEAEDNQTNGKLLECSCNVGNAARNRDQHGDSCNVKLDRRIAKRKTCKFSRFFSGQNPQTSLCVLLSSTDEDKFSPSFSVYVCHVLWLFPPANFLRG